MVFEQGDGSLGLLIRNSTAQNDPERAMGLGRSGFFRDQ